MTQTDTRTYGHSYRGVSVSVRVGMSRGMSGTCPDLSGLSGLPAFARINLALPPAAAGPWPTLRSCACRGQRGKKPIALVGTTHSVSGPQHPAAARMEATKSRARGR